VQFKQSRGYLSQSCGLPALKDRVIVVIDGSELSFEAHNDVWKRDREHVRDTIAGERYKKIVTEEISKSEALKKFQNEVALSDARRSLLPASEMRCGTSSTKDPPTRKPPWLRFRFKGGWAVLRGVD
jgi:hypothetical protein